MESENVLLLKMHPCVRGLDDDVISEIAAATELLRLSPGDCIQHANEPVTAVYLIIQGRLKLILKDSEGRTVLQRFQTAGGQFGGLAAALAEPAGIDCFAEDPSAVLKLDYEAALELTKKHPVFRRNVTQLLAEGVKQTLFDEKRPIRPRLIAVLHQSSETRDLSRRLIKRLKELGESPCVLGDRPDWEPIEGVRYRCTVEGDRRMRNEDARQQVFQWSESQRIIIDESTEAITQAEEWFERCAIVLWCVTSENWRKSVPLLQALTAKTQAWRDKVCIVWLLDREQTAPLATELTQHAKQDIKVSLAAPQPNQGPALNHGFERLVHFVRGVQIGVALGGGAARGMAHLGVLKALEQNGIVVDMIAGTSAGAMTGTVYAAGIDVDYAVQCFVNDLRPSWLFRHLPRGEQWYLLYKYRRNHFDPMLRKYLHDSRLEQLPVTMNSITVDLISGNAVVRDTGDAVHGIVESINLPVLSTPINREGQALVDGGLLKNVPADVLVSKGCNFVIAVSVSAKIEHEFARNRPDTPTPEMRSASTVQTVLRSYLVQSTSVNAIGVQPADIVIEPDVTTFDLTAFTQTDELAAVGEQTALESISKIKASLSQLDRELFPLPEV